MQRCKAIGQSYRILLAHACDQKTAAQVALTFPVEANERFTGHVGRPRSNLFTLIKKDMMQRNLKPNNIEDLNDLRDISRCRERWKTYSNYKCLFQNF